MSKGTTPLLEQLAARETLVSSFQEVRSRRGAPGVDRVSVEDFAADLERELEGLATELRQGSYRPSPVLRIRPRSVGAERPITVPTVRDRVVQRALGKLLSPRLDPLFLDCSFAYRPGRSATQAAARVEAHLARGRGWVVRADVEKFFERIDHQLLLAALAQQVGDDGIVALVERFLKAAVLDRASYLEPVLGTHQGSALSPLLANLYLNPFDSAVVRHCSAYVRYADDMALLVSRQEEAEALVEILTAELARLKLRLNNAKTRVQRAAEGFVFLGFHFGPQGRGPCEQAVSALHQRLAEVLHKAPGGLAPPPLEELDALARGWDAYYGGAEEHLGGDLGGLLASLRLRRPGEGSLETLVESRRRLGRGPAWLHLALTEQWRRHGAWLPALEEAAAALGVVSGDPGTALRLMALLRLPEPLAGTIGPLLFDLGRPGGRDEAARQLAEVLAEAGEYDAARWAALAASTPAVVQQEEGGEAVVLVAEDVDLFLELFSGREGVYAREEVDEAGHRRYRPVGANLDEEALRRHLGGQETLGLPLVRANGTVVLAVLDVDVSRKEILLSGATGDRFRVLLASAHDYACRLLRAAGRLGARGVLEDSGYRGRHVWFFFERAVRAADARRFGERILAEAGPAPEGVTAEVFPSVDRVKPGDEGPVIKLPWGRHGRSGRVSLFLGVDGRPFADQPLVLRRLARVDPDAVRRALAVEDAAVARGGGGPRAGEIPRAAVARPRPGVGEPAEHGAEIGTDRDAEATRVEAEGLADAAPGREQELSGADEWSAEPTGPRPDTSPEQGRQVASAAELMEGLPLALAVVDRCVVVRHIVEKARQTGYIDHGERLLLLNTLGHLGDRQGAEAIHRVMRLTLNYDQRVTDKFVGRRLANAISCTRIRETRAELTAALGCDCRFRLPAGAYPSPVLHAIRPTRLPCMSERVGHEKRRREQERERAVPVAPRGEPEGSNSRQETRGAGDEFSRPQLPQVDALVTRLAELRRQMRALQKAVDRCHGELDEVLDGLGVDQLEIATGRLVRVRDPDGGKSSFRIDV
ncbi:MAG: CRISPR-associated primase-polymerase type A1 [Myxococcota bacterium]|jgi:group II intron reverse transcriptase/maturase|nr:CRISPR-associated primase-polymerase type A1 [Myxococcota bacterium]